MCDNDLEGPAVQVLSWVRARKPKQCCACETVVAVGALYHKYKSLYDGDWAEFDHCARCWAMCEALWAMNGGEAIDLGLNCGEVWNGAPPEVAELAFTLPGENADKGEGEYADGMRMRKALRELRRASA